MATIAREFLQRLWALLSAVENDPGALPENRETAAELGEELLELLDQEQRGDA